MRDTEFVRASKVQEGDELAGGRGIVTKRLNDSGLLTFETPVTVFMKGMNSPLERFVRVPNGQYGRDWNERTCHCQHGEEDHNYTPSGCGSTHCMVDNEYGGYSPTCECREYWPAIDPPD